MHGKLSRSGLYVAFCGAPYRMQPRSRPQPMKSTLRNQLHMDENQKRSSAALQKTTAIAQRRRRGRGHSEAVRRSARRCKGRGQAGRAWQSSVESSQMKTCAPGDKAQTQEHPLRVMRCLRRICPTTCGAGSRSSGCDMSPRNRRDSSRQRTSTAGVQKPVRWPSVCVLWLPFKERVRKRRLGAHAACSRYPAPLAEDFTSAAKSIRHRGNHGDGLHGQLQFPQNRIQEAAHRMGGAGRLLLPLLLASSSPPGVELDGRGAALSGQGSAASTRRRRACGLRPLGNSPPSGRAATAAAAAAAAAAGAAAAGDRRAGGVGADPTVVAAPAHHVAHRRARPTSRPWWICRPPGRPAPEHVTRSGRGTGGTGCRLRDVRLAVHARPRAAPGAYLDFGEFAHPAARSAHPHRRRPRRWARSAWRSSGGWSRTRRRTRRRRRPSRSAPSSACSSRPCPRRDAPDAARPRSNTLRDPTNPSAVDAEGRRGRRRRCCRCGSS